MTSQIQMNAAEIKMIEERCFIQATRHLANRTGVSMKEAKLAINALIIAFAARGI